MKPPIAVIQCERRPAQPAPPGVGPGLLVYELERRGYPVFRWYASEFHLEDLGDEVRAAGCRMVVLDAEVPAHAIGQLRVRLGPVPIVLVGEGAADNLLPSGVPFAIVGGAREAVGRLAEVLGRYGLILRPTAADLRQVPNLLYRTDAVSEFESREAFCIDGSDVLVPWSVESELFPYAPPLYWNYRGPGGRNPAVDRVRLPITGCLGCMHPTFVEDAPLPSGSNIQELSERARRIQSAAAYAVEACPLGLCPGEDLSRERTLARALQQTEYLWEQGIRSFRLVGVHSIDLAKDWLDALDAQSWRPEEIVLSPSVRELRRGEARLVELLREHGDTRFVVSGTTFWFNALFERSGQPSSWESRWAGRLLTRLAKENPGVLTCLEGHDVVLLDPETSLQQLLDALQAIEEDAPFLKRALSGGSMLPPFRPESRIGRYLAREGLDGGTLGIETAWRFRDPELETFADLVGRGRAPLLESIGRLRAQPEVRDALVAEGAFRWFRELARFLIENRGSARRAEDAWGRVLAAVAQDLERDRTRSA